MKFASFDACMDVVSKHLLQTIHVGTSHVFTPAFWVEVQSVITSNNFVSFVGENPEQFYICRIFSFGLHDS